MSQGVFTLLSFKGVLVENGFSLDTQAMKSIVNDNDTLDLSDIPEKILHTATVEALIAQNEDLMARLKMYIRRNSILEQETQHINQKNKTLKQTLSKREDQSLIWGQKDQAWRNKLQSLEDKIKQSNNDTDTAQMRYSQLYETFQLKQQEFSNLKKILQEKVNNNKNNFERKQIELSEKNKKLQKNIEELTAHIASQKKKHEADQVKLVTIHEADQVKLVTIHEKERNKMDATINKLTIQKMEFESATQKLNKSQVELTEQKVILENELIEDKRRKKEIAKKLQSEISELQEQLTFFRKESKTLKLQLQKKEELLTVMNNHEQSLQEKVKQQRVQLENLQVLWKQKQEELEKQKEQNRAMEKINVELGESLSKFRNK